MSLDELHKKAVAIRNEAWRQTLEELGENELSTTLQESLNAKKNSKKRTRTQLTDNNNSIPDSLKRRSGRLAGQERVSLNVGIE